MTETRQIYFMKPKGMDGPIKIGCSEFPRCRLEQISTWSPFPLEIIGSVNGSFSDENYLHNCFAKSHSHREWFHATPDLVEAIGIILEAGNVDAIRGKYVLHGPIRKAGFRTRHPELTRSMSYNMRVIWAEKRLRNRFGENGKWETPRDVSNILRSWSHRTCKGGNMEPPSAEEMARIEEYLANPEAHSVYPSWVKVAGAAA